MRTKKYVKLFLIMTLSVLMLMISGCEKKSPSNDEKENVLVVEERKERDVLQEGVFESETPRGETSNAKTLGGSETLEVILPKEDSEDETNQDSEKSEWIPGIW